MKSLGPLIRKECMEEVFSSRGLLFYVLGCAVLSVFSVLLVSNTELSLLDNAHAVYMMTGIVISLSSLIAVIQGSDGFAGERERETLETLLLSPVSSKEIALGKLANVLFAWLIFFVISIPYLWAVGSTGQNLGLAIGYLFVAGSLLSLIFGGFTLALSAKMKTFKGVLSVGFTLFLLLSGVPTILGPSLRQNSIGKIADLVNPFANALNMLDSVVIDSQGLPSQIPYLMVIIGYSLVALGCLYLVARKVEL